MTDQPPSQQPAEEPEGDKPAALVPDDAPTQVSVPAPEPPTAPSEPPPAAPPAYTPPPPPPPTATEPPSSEPASSAGPGALATAFPPDRPERAVGAAFAGGLVLALILKRLAR